MKANNHPSRFLLFIIMILLFALSTCSAQSESPKRIKIGNIVGFGHYEQDNNKTNGKETVEWIVLSVQNNQAMLISRFILDSMPYNSKYADTTWAQCTLRTWLNNDFLNATFSKQEKKAILVTTVDNSKKEGDTNSKSSKGSSNTKDKVFLLSYNEAFNRFFSNDYDRISLPTAYAIARGVLMPSTNRYIRNTASLWWLRTSGYGSSQAFAYYISTDGTTRGTGVNADCIGIRPVIWIDLGVYNPTVISY